jgi:hypothetical protein
MNKMTHLSSKLAIILCGPLLGYTAYAQPSVSVGVSVPTPSMNIEIRADSDFYEPLAPQGEWVTIGTYGRCWRPGHVARDWRPYCNGNWELTDAGWYWVSDEPWAWATYHYGRWDFTDQYGWYWVPQTQWAPAWVSWHEGGGYVGWAPLQPSVTLSASGFVGFNQARISPRAFVFVEQRRFLEPIRPTTVVANNTTIINKTVNITNTKIVNNNVINEGPKTQVIEQVSGRKIQAVPVSELRRKQEAPLVAKQQIASPTTEKKEKSVQTPVGSEVEPRVKKAVAAPVPSPVEKPEVAPRAPTALTPTGRVKENEPGKANPSQAEPRPEIPRPGAIKEPAEPKAPKYDESSDKKSPGKPVPLERPAASEKDAPNKGDKDHGRKDKE